MIADRVFLDQYRLWLALLTLVLALPAAADDFWPKVLTGDRGEVVVYQPQIESLEGQTLQSRAAVSVKLAGETAPVFGAMWFESRLSTDQETRMATLEDVKVTAARFPDVDDEKVAELSAYLEQEMPTWDFTFSIDRIIAGLAADDEFTGGADGYNNKPPVIYMRDHPTVLVTIDGDPIFQDLDGPNLEYVVNSAFFLVREPGQKSIYLRGSGTWFTAQDIAGPWTVASDLPEDVIAITPQLEAEEKEQAEAAAADAKELELEPSDEAAPPEVIVTTEPAEVIVTDGAPDFASVEGTQLLYLKNTETDVIMDIASQQYFVLLAGRWYRGPSLDEGPWTHVAPDEVPEDFALIPTDSDMAGVLPSVAGTQEAREAVLETQIPQTAEVDRKTATVTVTYDGDPEFESCAEGVAYARNTDKSVLLIDGVYYCCDEAVWFLSIRPDGPWEVASEVPAVVQDLPPECPVYNVKYVYIYESTPEVVYVGYTPGYYNCYVYHGCVVYGTGWYYQPWYGHYYYPRPVTYGFGVHYNPWTGWGFSYGVSYGWITIGVSWGRSPYYGWGAGGYRYGYRRGYWRGYNHGYRHGYRRGYNRGAAAGYRAGYRAGQRQPSNNAYRNRSNGVARTGDVGKQARQKPATSDRRNDVYTDRNGNVYRDKDGSWEKREGGKWESDGGQKENRESDRQRDGEKQDRSQQDRSQQDRSQQDRSQQDRSQQDRSQQDRSQQDRSQQDRSQQEYNRDRGSSNRNQQELNRDRSSRDRGTQRQRQAPSGGRSGGRSGGGRGGRR